MVPVSRGPVFSGQNTATENGRVFQVGRDYHAHGSLRDETKEVLKWFPNTDFRKTYHEILEKRCEGTAEWVFDMKEFQTWYRSDISSLLWCWGARGSQTSRRDNLTKKTAGAGKSVLAAAVLKYIETFLNLKERVGVCYCFFKYNETDVQRPTMILGSFIKQLCRNMTLTRIKKLAYESFDSIYILVDALDEYNSKERQKIMDVFFKIIDNIPKAKILIKSRREVDIAVRFTRERIPIVEMQADIIGEDIKRYVSKKSEELTICDEELRKEVVTTLAEKSNGMFLWVKFQITGLLKKKRAFEIKKALSHLPKGLKETYDRIMEQIDGQEDDALKQLAKSTLLWVLYAAQPLTIEELQDAVSIGEECATREHLMDRRCSRDTILISCSNLIRVKDNDKAVELIHFSVQEYLTDSTSPPSHGIRGSTADPEVGYNQLSIDSLRYLNLLPHTRFLGYSPWQREPSFVFHVAYFFDVYTSNFQDVVQEVIDALSTFISGERQALLYNLLRLRSYRNKKHDFTTADFTSREPTKASFQDLLYATRLYTLQHLLPQRKRLHTIPENALHLSASYGNINAVIDLIGKHYSASKLDENGVPPLYYACEGGHFDITTQLVSQHADVNVEGGEYSYPLLVATRNNHPRIVGHLLDEGAHINLRDNMLGTALCIAARHDNRGGYGNALQAASSIGSVSIVELLLAMGAAANARGGIHGSALELALRERNTEIVQLLLKHGAVHPEGEEGLKAAIAQMEAIIAEFKA
ncbi:hypothetical protein BJ875DRAFT_510270 [Amylocarpus encephaloides]|uniref:NACHT domain-containing protein n=1 Tax=Amylocarpus encephaloides TaxID=45428 RepID=A0A9P7YIL4_9HELO|nr:hypothetical protein BJ875DRAFT_510270 [Amylocarpus encephaloides]